jgi:NADPH:quinone reductase-like Zn-dependent oxidoreductase
MRAIVLTKYGPPSDVLQLKDVEKPTPTDDQVLVRVLAASVNKADLAPIRGALLARLLGTGLREPKTRILGTDVAGRVEAVGRNVRQLQPGDEVFGLASGAFAEYACATAGLLALKPANATFEEAAAVPLASITALQGLRKGQIRSGQRVLINGASGGVGSFAVQIAKSFGTEVTAVCSRQNLDNARSIGADHVIDYTQEDFTRNRQKYDLILAVNGHHPILGYRGALSSKGICVVLGGSVAQMVQSLLFGPLISRTGTRKIGFMGIAKPNQKDLLLVRDLLEDRRIEPSLDRRYPLSETVQAILALEEGHARGKLAIAG